MFQISLAKLRIAAILLVALMLAGAAHFGVFHQFAEPARAAQKLLELGAWGYLAFILSYAMLQPFGLPGTVFVLAAPLIWPWPTAFALSMAGSMCASIVGFSFARLVARDWISKVIPARFRRYDEALAKRAFRTVFFLRLIFWMPPLLHAFFGVSKVGFWTHVFASFLGYLLPIFLISFFGQRIFDAMRAVPMSDWVALSAVIVFFLLGAHLFRKHRMRAERSVRDEPTKAG